MRVFPALKAAIIFSVGIVLALWLPVNFSFLATIALTSILLYLLPLGGAWKQILTTMAILTTGALAYSSASLPNHPKTSPLFMTCVVEEPPLFRDGYFSFPARTITAGSDSTSRESFSHLIWVRGKGTKPPELGATLLLQGSLFPFVERRNPGDFNLKRWRENSGFVGDFNATTMIPTSSDQFRPVIVARRWLIASCDRLARGDAPLWKGLLLGFRRDIDPELMEELRLTGLTHLLALSGLNIGLLALSAIALASLIRLPLHGRFIFALIIVLIFAQLIPDRGSTQRATIMTVVLILGYLFRQWTPSLNSLGFAGLIVLALRPLDLFDPGFQLSFTATAGIFLLQTDVSKVNNWKHNSSGRMVRIVRHWVLVPLAISVVASSFTTPLTSNHFSSIPLGGPIFNLIAVPLVGIIFAGAWLAIILQPLSLWLAYLVADGVVVISHFWLASTHAMAQIAPEWRFTFAPWEVIAIFLVLIWFGISHKPFYKRFSTALLALLTITVIATIKLPANSFQALFLEVGHGDAQLWLFPDRTTWLIDSGPESPFPEGKVARVLHRLNTSSIDAAVASHPDADHIGSFQSLIQDFPIRTALRNYSTDPSQTFQTLEKVSLENRVVWRQLAMNDSISGLPNGFKLKTLNPPIGADKWSDNNLSLVMRLEVPVEDGLPLSLLTTGDVEEKAEDFLIQQGGLRSGLLKVPHHGSPTSSTEEFIKAVSPEIAIISRGARDEFVSQAARAAVSERYKREGAHIYYTSNEGAVLMEASQRGWQFVDWRYPTFGRWLMGEL